MSNDFIFIAVKPCERIFEKKIAFTKSHRKNAAEICPGEKTDWTSRFDFFALIVTVVFRIYLIAVQKLKQFFCQGLREAFAFSTCPIVTGIF